MSPNKPSSRSPGEIGSPDDVMPSGGAISRGNAAANSPSKAQARALTGALTGALAAARAARAVATPQPPRALATAKTANSSATIRPDAAVNNTDTRSDTKTRPIAREASIAAAGPDAKRGLQADSVVRASAVNLQVGGQSYRVFSSADAKELERLAAKVDAKLGALGAAKGSQRSKLVASPQMLLLAAIALAHDLEAEEERRCSLERRTRDLVRRTLSGLEEVMESERFAGAASSAGPRSTRHADAQRTADDTSAVAADRFVPLNVSRET